MSAKILRAALATALLILCALTAVAQAQEEWVDQGLVFCPLAGSQRDPAVCSDGQGGVIVAWTDLREGSPHIYAQKLNGWGNPLWAEDGVPICTYASGEQSQPKAASDGAGGAYIAWFDVVPASNTQAVYAQHVGADGTVSWMLDGLPLTTGSDYSMTDIRIAATEDGAAVVLFGHNQGGDFNLYAQRLEASGGKMWAEWGVVVCDETGLQYNSRICCLGGAETAMIWEDYRGGAESDIYAVGLDGAGSRLWYWSGPNAICNEPGNQVDADIAPDRQGGFYCCWRDYRTDPYGDIYVGRIDNEGYSWTTDGLPACILAGTQSTPRLADTSGGVIVAWTDNRTGATNDLYMQYFTRALAYQLAGDGIVFCDASGRQYISDMITDGNDGALLVWQDERLDNDFDLYAQRLSYSGGSTWTGGGIPVCVRDGAQYQAMVADDGEGGLITVWTDETYANVELAAQRIERHGNWGYPAPNLLSATDVPGDQGGEVLLWMEASRLDPWPQEMIAGYSLWRTLAPTSEPLSTVETENWRAQALGEEPAKGPIVRIGEIDGQQYFWEMVGSFDAYGRDQYMATVPTWCDSTGADPADHFFQAVAHHDYGYDFFSGLADGHSVDNLAPAVPENLAGEASYAEGGLLLCWEPNAEADLAGYRVYRGADSGFIPDPAAMVAAPADTAWFDGDWGGSSWWYKVTAIDVHGNESPWAALGPDAMTGVGGVPRASFLAQNAPNPFNPATVIRFGLNGASGVMLRIYDPAGRLVRTLADRAFPAGEHSLRWDGRDDDGAPCASGVYVYRIEASGFSRARRMMLVR